MKSSLILVLLAAIFSPLVPVLEAQPAGKTNTYQLNERIEVNTLGSWDKATIIEIGKSDHEGEFKVHYDGWASSFDRWLRPIYFRKMTASAATTASSSTPAAKAALYQLNERIEVNTLGSWDKATIIEVGKAEHENEFKVHYDGWASSFDRWLLPLYFRKTAASNSVPATTPAVPVVPAAVASVPAGESNSVPRLGKYNINSYGATGNAPLFLGHIELLKGGKYRISRKSTGDYYGEGAYSFDAATQAVKWLSGPCKDNDWTGTFTVEREGKTHKIRLRSSTIATSNTD